MVLTLALSKLECQAGHVTNANQTQKFGHPGIQPAAAYALPRAWRPAMVQGTTAIRPFANTPERCADWPGWPCVLA
jgi:hypothetical protein